MLCKYCGIESEWTGSRWHERGDPCCGAIQELRRTLAEEIRSHNGTKLELAHIRADLARYERLYHEAAEMTLPQDQQEYLQRKRRLEAQQIARHAR